MSHCDQPDFHIAVIYLVIYDLNHVECQPLYVSDFNIVQSSFSIEENTSLGYVSKDF